MSKALAFTFLLVLGLPQHGRCFSLRRLFQLAIPSPYSPLLSNYMSNEDMAAWLKSYAERCSHVSKLSSFGRSAGGAELLALEISSTPGQRTSKPEFKYVANIHGDEPSGRQLLLALAEKLCTEYPSNSLVKKVVDSLHLFLIPTINPDGFRMKHRENMASVDLNRNFPDPLKKTRLRSGGRPGRDDGEPQPEVQALMDFTLRHKFVASLALHEGALVANYPMDGYPDGSYSTRGIKQPSPDDASFMYIANLYAQRHKTMAASKEFKGGVTNGAQWYPLYGGMQDWNYLVAGCMELTLELNDNKWPKPNRLAEMWLENEQALLEWPLAVGLGGLHGSVRGIGPANGVLPIVATVAVQGIPHNISTSPEGVFHRVLAPGKYTVTVIAPGYTAQTADITIPADGATGVTTNFTLSRMGAATFKAPASVASFSQPDGTVRVVSPQMGISKTTASSGFLASNQKALAFVGLQVLVIGTFIAWRKRRNSTSFRSAL
uniref:Peptidase M14 domain-containing protein n=1 Tax=Dunaliella tertiolecta TaxID=3047 RepID=A0A7S3QMS3_DUNTE|mmetsp:Transcript_1794/g.4546  ORF Transcript_1794/g.4546 Transcript_1794/m.4546 type:complete len:491 (+) Transcript_1794:67-1539(+)